jgi:hypothetical protein
MTAFVNLLFPEENTKKPPALCEGLSMSVLQMINN